MTRARSGSFYCPVEPAWAPLSLVQKAALSTANKCNPKAASPAIRARRQFKETDSLDSVEADSADSVPVLPLSARATAASQQPTASGAAIPVAVVANPNPSTVDKDSDSDSDSESTSLPKSLPRQRFFPSHSRSQSQFTSPATATATATTGMTYANANAAFARRHAYSPRQPSPLRRQANEKVCPSALWTTHTDLLAFYGQTQPQPQYQPRKRHSRSSSCPNPMLKTVLKNGFLSGPMAEKARMYGLRVAWCVFGDLRDVIGRDMFAGSNARRPPHRSAHSVDSVINVTSVPSAAASVPLAPRRSKRQSYPTNSATLTNLLDPSISTTTTSRLRRSPSSLILDTDPIDPILLGDGDEGDAIILEHSEDVQVSIDEKVAEWEKEVHRRAIEEPLDSSSSSSSSSYEEEEPSSRLFRVSRDEEDSDESDSVYDDCSDEELHYISGSDPDSDSYSDGDSDSDSSESAESLDDEAEVERDVFSILERTILGHNTHSVSSNSNNKNTIDIEVNVNVDVKVEVEVNVPEVSVTVGSPPTPWELPFVGFVGDL